MNDAHGNFRAPNQTARNLQRTSLFLFCALAFGCGGNASTPENAAEPSAQTNNTNLDDAARAVANWFVGEDVTHPQVEALLVEGRPTLIEHADEASTARTNCTTYADLNRFRSDQNERSLNGPRIQCAEDCCEFLPPEGETPDIGDFHTVLTKACFESSATGLHLSELHTFDGGV